MDEIAAKHVLLDVEIVALLVLATGVAFYALARKARGASPFGSGAFDGYDLVLVFFPALLFLFNPALDLAIAKREATMDAGSGGTGEGAPAIATMVVNIVYFAFVGTMTFGILEWVRGRRVSELFGLRRRSFPVVLFISLAGGILSVALCAKVVGDLSSGFLEKIFTDLAAQETVERLQETQSPLFLVFSIVMACVAAPLVEELLFRGYFYGVVRQVTGPLFAAVVVGALFATVHGNLPALLPLWAFALLLCLAYELSGSLWVPIGMHAVFNGANILLMRFAPTG